MSFLVLTSAILSAKPQASTIYVSPRGSDRASGSRAAPLATLEAALAVLRAAPGRNRIVLAPGDYPVRRTIELDASESGLTVDGDGKARLLGGEVVKSWRPVRDADVLARLTPEARAHVVACDLPDLDLGEMKRRGFGLPEQTAGLELFFGHRPMPLARYPNEGWLRTASAPNAKAFTYDGDRPDRWKSLGDVWTLGYWSFDWAESYEKAAHIDRQTRTVELADTPVYPVAKGRRFVFLNVLEELDRPGEWYLDRPHRILYFWPPSPIGESEALVSVASGPLLRARNAANLTLRGLDLEGGRDGAIRIEGGENDRVEGCRIENFGTYGVAVAGGRNSGVAGCSLTGLGELGISLDGGDRQTLTPAGLYADDNHLWAYSRWRRTYAPAIEISGVGNRASHNLIHDAPHNAILLSGNDHLLEYNDVSRVCTETGDAGAFYMGRDTTMRGNRIRFNRFREIGPTVRTSGNFDGVSSVYLDDCFAGVTIFGNVFEGPGIGVLLGGGRDNAIENNVFLAKSPAILFDARGKGWAAASVGPGGVIRQRIEEVHGDQPPYTTRYPRLAGILRSDLGFPAGNAVVRNVDLGGKWIEFQNGLSEKDLDYRGDVVAAEGSLAAALRAAPPGFHPIPIREIGPRKGRLRLSRRSNDPKGAS